MSIVMPRRKKDRLIASFEVALDDLAGRVECPGNAGRRHDVADAVHIDRKAKALSEDNARDAGELVEAGNADAFFLQTCDHLVERTLSREHS
jgi:hypothetical protein